MLLVRRFANASKLHFVSQIVGLGPKILKVAGAGDLGDFLIPLFRVDLYLQIADYVLQSLLSLVKIVCHFSEHTGEVAQLICLTSAPVGQI